MYQPISDHDSNSRQLLLAVAAAVVVFALVSLGAVSAVSSYTTQQNVVSTTGQPVTTAGTVPAGQRPVQDVSRRVAMGAGTAAVTGMAAMAPPSLATPAEVRSQ